MENTITTSIPGLQVAAGKANAGLLKYGQQIGLVHNTSEKLVTELTDLVMAVGGYDEGGDELVTRNDVLRALAAKARTHAMLARETLKPYLGSQYNEAWDATGYRGSLETPDSADDLQPMMATMSGYYTAHPEREVAPLNLTAAYAKSLSDDMMTAAGAIVLQEKLLDDLLVVRNEKAAVLRRRLRMIIEELDLKLTPLDSLWLAFGFNKPGADRTPDVPQGVKVTLIGPTAVAVKWETAPRAEYYRVWKKVDGVDTELIVVGSPADLDFTIENLPPNASIQIAVSAVNSGGESLASQAVTIVTH